MNHSLISSSYHSKHGSVTGKRMHRLNRRESWFPSHGFRTVFWSYFLILNLFLMKSLWIHRFTTVFTPCKPLNLSRFWKIFRVSKLLNQTRSKSYGSMLIQIRCGSWVWRGEFLILTCVLFGDLDWNLQNSLNLILFCWFWFEIRKWIGVSSSSSSPVRNLWNSFPFLLNFSFLWSYGICCFQWRILCFELQKQSSMMMIQHWITENQRKLHWICFNCASGNLGFVYVLEFLVNFGEFDL